MSDDTIVWVGFIQGAQFEERESQDTGDTVQLGFFILAAPNSPSGGEIEGASLIDIVPTLLELGGYDILASMQGQSLVSDTVLTAATETALTADEEEILRERLSGLGYIA